MSDLIPASVRPDLPPDALLDAAILSIRSVRHSSDMHRGAISWLSETLWPAIGDMALELRAGGVIEPEDGWSLRGLGIHSRHRSDLLLSGPDARIHVMVDHLPRMTAAGMEADMRLREAEGRDYIRSILDPGPERLAFHDTASNWLDPAAGDFVSSIGARALAQGEDPVSDIRKRSIPDCWSPGSLCHLRPNLSFHERLCDTPALSTHPPCDDPFAELRVLELMSRALVLHGFGERVAARNARLSGMEWVQYGDAGAALRQGAGMRLAHEAGGLVTAELRTAMARLECAAVGRMLEDSLHDIRSLPGMLRVSGALDEGSGFTCNDARDRIWSTFSDGTETLHVDCAAGRLALEMDEGGGIRILREDVGPAPLLAFGNGSGMLEPDMANSPAPSMEAIRSCNTLRLSLESALTHLRSPEDDLPRP